MKQQENGWKRRGAKTPTIIYRKRLYHIRGSVMRPLPLRLGILAVFAELENGE